MATIISVPDQHSCDKELRDLGTMPIGTVAECSCGVRYVAREDQWDGVYWTYQR